MNKFSKGCLVVMASLTMGTGVTVATNAFYAPTTYAASLSKEKTDLANRYIADYLSNCQQYEANDKTFRGYTSIKDITYTSDNHIKIDVNDDIYQLSKARRTLLVQSLQNGVYGTLADNDLKNMSEKDLQKGCKTTIYLNGHVIGQSSKNDTRMIKWNK